MNGITSNHVFVYAYIFICDIATKCQSEIIEKGIIVYTLHKNYSQNSSSFNWFFYFYFFIFKLSSFGKDFTLKERKKNAT